VNYYHTSNNANKTNCLSGIPGIGAQDPIEKEATLKEYQKRLLKSIEKRTMKQSGYNQFPLSGMDHNSI
jgi:hypothetical protein